MNTKQSIAAIVTTAALLMTSAAWAKAPAWPTKATLILGGHQPLWNEPARTTAELLRQERSYGISVAWPVAIGAKVYEIRKDGRVLTTVKAPAKYYSAVIERPTGKYEVRAGDGAGHWSPPLTDVMPDMRSRGTVYGLFGGDAPEGQYNLQGEKIDDSTGFGIR